MSGHAVAKKIIDTWSPRDGAEVRTLVDKCFDAMHCIFIVQHSVPKVDTPLQYSSLSLSLHV